jgi:hypothetical protein
VGYFVYDASPVMLIVWAETTRGVYQASGYGDVNADKSIWFVPSNWVFLCFYYYPCFTARFWFFAARTNPNTAPLITWFNGGVSDTAR